MFNVWLKLLQSRINITAHGRLNGRCKEIPGLARLFRGGTRGSLSAESEVGKEPRSGSFWVVKCEGPEVPKARGGRGEGEASEARVLKG